MIRTELSTKSNLIKCLNKLNIFKQFVSQKLTSHENIFAYTKYMQKLCSLLNGFQNMSGNDWISCADYDTKSTMVHRLHRKINNEISYDNLHDVQRTYLDLAHVKHSYSKWFDYAYRPITKNDILYVIGYMQFGIKYDLMDE